jgi:hypothetical protein
MSAIVQATIIEGFDWGIVGRPHSTSVSSGAALSSLARAVARPSLASSGGARPRTSGSAAPLPGLVRVAARPHASSQGVLVIAEGRAVGRVPLVCVPARHASRQCSVWFTMMMMGGDLRIALQPHVSSSAGGQTSLEKKRRR